MASVVLQNVTRQFGHKVVLEDVTVEVRTGETIGLVGVNGAGKSTLFRLMAGEIQPDMGTVTRTRGLSVGHLEQEPRLDSTRTLFEEVSSIFAELGSMDARLHDLSHAIAEHHDDPKLPQLLEEYDRLHGSFEARGGHSVEVRLNEVLGGLGFTEADHRLPIAALSGGQKCRAALAKLLLQDNTLLLLDEPTNHLDIDATRWLERFLAGHHGGAVIISHDRYLLDRLAEKIMEMDSRKVQTYPGNYSNYVAAKGLRALTQARQYQIDQEFIRKERDFIARHMAGQRTREAKGRLARLERRLADGELVTEQPISKRRASIGFQATARGGDMVLRCEAAAKRYGDKTLFENLTFDVVQGQRLGITGPNGTGKSTLLKIAMRQAQADEGIVRLYENLKVGYYDQEHSDLDRTATILESVRAASPDLSEQQARGFLGRFLFSGDDVFKPIEKCSGGEQSRVRLARLMLARPQVLLLDEPTNHLDIPAREALEQALMEYDGTLIVVSHDRYFLDRVIERLLVLECGRHRLFVGNYSAYAAVEAERTTPATARREAASSERNRPRSSRGASKKTKRAPAGKPSSASKYDVMSVEEIEALIMDKEAAIAAMNDRFADPAIYRDAEEVRRLRENVETARAELAQIESHWHQRTEELES